QAAEEIALAAVRNERGEGRVVQPLEQAAPVLDQRVHQTAVGAGGGRQRGELRRMRTAGPREIREPNGDETGLRWQPAPDGAQRGERRRGRRAREPDLDISRAAPG